MIRLLRVDHRLLHGQVAFAWTAALQADCILIANDIVVNDKIKKASIKLAKPNGVKLVMKNIEDSIKALNSGVTDKYKLFIVVENIKDAAALANGVEAIKSINLGGTKATDKTHAISNAVNITDEEEKILNDLKKNKIEIELRQVPTESKKQY